MKALALTLVLLVTGFGSSYALAKGKPPKHGSSTATTATTGTTSTDTSTTTTTAGHGKKQAKLYVCHRAGKSGRYVKVHVATRGARQRLLKHGDVLPDASGKCPAPAPKHTTTSGETTTTTGK